MRKSRVPREVVRGAMEYYCTSNPEDVMRLTSRHGGIRLSARGLDLPTVVVILSEEDAMDMATRIMAFLLHGKSVTEDE